MINWIISGALAAVLMAEVFDAWALRRLFFRCRNIGRKCESDQRLLRWYAEGFDHSRIMTHWLSIAALSLAILSFLAGAHPAVMVACLVLMMTALVERRLSDDLHRKVLIPTR